MTLSFWVTWGQTLFAYRQTRYNYVYRYCCWKALFILSCISCSQSYHLLLPHLLVSFQPWIDCWWNCEWDISSSVSNHFAEEGKAWVTLYIFRLFHIEQHRWMTLNKIKSSSNVNQFKILKKDWYVENQNISAPNICRIY